MDTNELLFLTFPLYLVGQIYTLIKFKGVLKKYTQVSASIMALVVMYTAYALIKDSNLWPLVLLLVSPLALLYQFLLIIFSFAFKNGKTSEKIKQK